MILPSLVVLYAVGIYPFLMTIFYSLHRYYLPEGRMFFNAGFNYISIFKSAYFPESLKTTFIFVSMAVPLEFVLGMGLAILLNREVKGRRFFRFVSTLPLLLPPLLAALMWKLILSPSIGFINGVLWILKLPQPDWFGVPLAMLSLVLIDVWQWTPLIALILLAGLQSIPQDMVEAAMVDGAGGWQIFKSIVIPFLKPLILIALVIRFAGAFEVFDIVFTVTEGGPGSFTTTCSVAIYKTAYWRYFMGEAAAMTIVATFVLLFAASILFRVLRGVKK